MQEDRCQQRDQGGGGHGKAKIAVEDAEEIACILRLP